MCLRLPHHFKNLFNNLCGLKFEKKTDSNECLKPFMLVKLLVSVNLLYLCQTHKASSQHGFIRDQKDKTQLLTYNITLQTKNSVLSQAPQIKSATRGFPPWNTTQFFYNLIQPEELILLKCVALNHDIMSDETWNGLQTPLNHREGVSLQRDRVKSKRPRVRRRFTFAPIYSSMVRVRMEMYSTHVSFFSKPVPTSPTMQYPPTIPLKN